LNKDKTSNDKTPMKYSFDDKQTLPESFQNIINANKEEESEVIKIINLVALYCRL
jgi:hypothetical protein